MPDGWACQGVNACSSVGGKCFVLHGTEGGILPFEYRASDGGVSPVDEEFAHDFKALEPGQAYAFCVDVLALSSR